MKKIALQLFLTILLVVTIFTFAWFIENNDLSIDTTDDFECYVGNSSLQVSYMKADGTWSDYGNKISTSIKNILDDEEYEAMSMLDVTSKDGLEFYYPTALDDNEQPLYPLVKVEQQAPETYTEHLQNIAPYYMEFKIKVKSEYKCNLYLADNSYVSPVSAGEESASIYYDALSKDFIAGAARVAFIDTDDEGVESLNTLWIPNDKYELKYLTPTTVSFTKNGTREAQYGYCYNDADTRTLLYHYYDINDYITGRVKVGNTNLYNVTEKKLDDDTISVSPLKSTCNDTKALMYFGNGGGEQSITIRIWIEGTDRESDKAFNKGSFKYKLAFYAQTLDEDDTEEEISLNNFDGSFIFEEGNEDVAYVYSYDGLTWFNYSNMITGHEAYEYVYVKRKEILQKRYTKYYKISLYDFHNPPEPEGDN